MGRPEEHKEKKKRNYRIHFNFAAGKQPVEFNELVRTHKIKKSGETEYLFYTTSRGLSSQLPMARVTGFEVVGPKRRAGDMRKFKVGESMLGFSRAIDISKERVSQAEIKKANEQIKQQYKNEGKKVPLMRLGKRKDGTTSIFVRAKD